MIDWYIKIEENMCIVQFVFRSKNIYKIISIAKGISVELVRSELKLHDTTKDGYCRKCGC
jgi:hypothetical protein